MTENLTPEQLVCEMAGNMAIHAMTNKKQNAQQVADNMKALEKAIDGLPNLVEAADEAIEFLDASLNDVVMDLAAMRGSGSYSDQDQAEMQMAESGLEKAIGYNVSYGKCIRNLAKTQIGFAKILRHSLTLQLIYLGGQQFAADCAWLACKAGKGDEGMKAMWQERLGEDDPFVAPAPAPAGPIVVDAAPPGNAGPIIVDPDPPPPPSEPGPEFEFQE